MRKPIAILLGVIVLLAFAAIYVEQIWSCWAGACMAEPNGNQLFIATTLSGLVGAVVAMEFNEKLPLEELPATLESASSATGPQAVWEAAKKTFRFASANAIQFMIGAYAVVYLAVGIASVVTWYRLDEMPEFLKNLAGITLGLIVAVLRTMFRMPVQQAKPAAGQGQQVGGVTT